VVQIALVIEKCNEKPQIINNNINVITQQNKSKISRVIELYRIIKKLNNKGYEKVFVRISWVAACITILVGFTSNLKTYYWLSGQGSIENFQKLKWGFQKIKLLITSRLPFWFIKTYVYRFVTGPESMGDYMHKKMKVNPRKILILYNDININRFSKATDEEKYNYKESLNIPLNKKIILFVHRLSPVRKTLYFIPYIITEFFKTNSTNDYHFVFAGSGPEESELEKAIFNADVSGFITRLGAIPNGEIDKLYKIADIFINPTYAEGFPRVLIEAMACGLPIVTTDAGGIVDILYNSQKEFMIEKENRNLFAQKLVALSNLPKEQELLGRKNIEHVQKFSTQNVAKMYIDKIFVDL